MKELDLPPSKRPSLRVRILTAINKMVWSRDPNKNEVIRRCKVRVPIGQYKNGNTEYKVMLKCESCGAVVDKLDVDHIEPRIDPDVGFVSYDQWIDSTFVTPSKLQGLCKPCHKEKTVSENRHRKKT